MHFTALTLLLLPTALLAKPLADPTVAARTPQVSQEAPNRCFWVWDHYEITSGTWGEGACDRLHDQLNKECWTKDGNEVSNFQCNMVRESSVDSSFNLAWKDHNCVQNAIYWASPPENPATGVTCYN